MLSYCISYLFHMIEIQTLYQSLKLWIKLQFYFALTLTCSDTWLFSSPGDFDLQRVKESTYFFSWGAQEGEPAEGDEENWRASGEAPGPAWYRPALAPLNTRTLIQWCPAEPPEPPADGRCCGEPDRWRVEESATASISEKDLFLLDIQVPARTRADCNWLASPSLTSI